jgi:superkiller protein 3
MVAFQKTLEQNQKDPVAWTGLGNVYYKIGYLDDAIASYRKAIEYAPGLALPWNGLGDAYASVGRDMDAVMAFQKAVELNRNFAAPLLRLANMYFMQNRVREAVKAYQRALQIDPKNSAAWNELGLIYMKANLLNESASAFGQAIEIERGFGGAYLNLAMTCSKQGKNREAIQLCMRSIDLFEDDMEKAKAWNHLANFHRAVNEYDAAIQAYQKADQLRGKPVTNLPHTSLQPVETTLADALFHGIESNPIEGEFTESEEFMKETNNPTVWNEKGNIHFQNGDYEEAIASYNKAIQFDRSFGWAYSNLALTYLTLGKFTEAALIYRAGIDLLDSDAEKAGALNTLGAIYRHVNDYENAALAFQKADELDPENVGRRGEMTAINSAKESYTHQTWLELGDLFQKAGSYADAIPAYKKALELDPTNAAAFNNMAMTYAALGKYKDAVPLFIHAIELSENGKEKSSVWNRLGNLYRKMNDLAGARDAYQKAAQLSGEKSSLLERARLSLLSNCFVN